MGSLNLVVVSCPFFGGVEAKVRWRKGCPADTSWRRYRSSDGSFGSARNARHLGVLANIRSTRTALRSMAFLYVGKGTYSRKGAKTQRWRTVHPAHNAPLCLCAFASWREKKTGSDGKEAMRKAIWNSRNSRIGYAEFNYEMHERHESGMGFLRPCLPDFRAFRVFRSSSSPGLSSNVWIG